VEDGFMTVFSLKRALRFFPLLLFIIFIFKPESKADMRMWPLTEIVQLSEYICIAKVQQITERKGTGKEIILENELSVVENLKGSLPPDKPVVINTIKGLKDEPEFPPPGTNVVLFLEKDKSSGSLHTVFRFQGMWKSYTEKRTSKPNEQSLEEVNDIIQFQSDSEKGTAPRNKIWNYDEWTANRLWNQGKTLSEQKQDSEALNKFRQSIEYWPTIERLKHIKSLEDGANKTQAKSLRDEGYALQKKEDLKGAIEKYRESLKFWPDKQMEKHIALLDSLSQGKYAHDRVYNIIPCGLLETGQVTVPEDFIITYVTGPLQAEQGGKSISKVLANGDVVVTREQHKKRLTTPGEEMVYKQIPVAGVKKIYSYVTACGFFDLKKQYWNRDVRDGISEYLEVTAGGQTHSVTVYYYHVERFDAILTVLEDEMKNAVKRIAISAEDAEKIVWELSEVKLRADQIRKGGGKPFTKIEARPEKNAKPGTPQSAYTIYFGEDMGTHTNRVWTFLIDAQTKKISVYDTVTDSTSSLREWRKSKTY
jgi:tetratricopeptide (TPR) repeat protein